MSAAKLRDAGFLLDAKKVKSLLAKGISPKLKDKDGTDLLFQVTGNNLVRVAPEKTAAQEAIIRAAVAAGADVNVPYKKFGNFTPLILAASAGCVRAVEVLIELGATVDLPDEHGFTPLHRAALSGRAEVVKVLLAAGADPRLKCSTKADALKLAIEGRDDSSDQDGEDYPAIIALLKKLRDGGPPPGRKGPSANSKPAAAVPARSRKVPKKS